MDAQKETSPKTQKNSKKVSASSANEKKEEFIVNPAFPLTVAGKDLCKVYPAGVTKVTVTIME